jgi:hypothetical protein
MEILGRPAGPVRPPLVKCAPDDLEDLRQLMLTYSDWTKPALLKR